MDIDVVITWVDGFEPAYLERRRRYRRATSEGAFAASDETARYADAGELLYCLRSIFHYMGWANRVFLVTDNQFPRYLDVDAIAGSRITVVSHEEIFRGYTSYLPVFSSTAIESMIHRVPELSEHFILFNDDCFLGNPIEPEDFFRPGKLRVRGTWRAYGQIEDLPDWQARQANASMRAGAPAGKFLLSHHAPFALTKSSMHAVWEEFHGDVIGNISRRFRDRHMTNLVSLCHARALLCQQAEIVDARDRMQFSSLSDGTPSEKVDRMLNVIERSYQLGVKFCCINDLSWLQRHSDRINEILDRMSGPPLPFECPARTGPDASVDDRSTAPRL